MKPIPDRILPNFDIKIGGSTSIDITKKGINRGFGIRKVSEVFGIPISEMLFFGDKLQDSGNDYTVREIRVDYIII